MESVYSSEAHITHKDKTTQHASKMELNTEYWASWSINTEH